MKIPKSIPKHLLSLNSNLWTLPENKINWSFLDLNKKNFIISGSAFIDKDDPLGTKGSPFTVVTGKKVQDLSIKERKELALRTGTPETIFLNSIHKTSDKNYELNLTVYTPSGKELGACAHGFIGTITTSRLFNMISTESNIIIKTTLQTTAKAYINKTNKVLLEFEVYKHEVIDIENKELERLLNVNLELSNAVPVLSVGSPKLTIEVDEKKFDNLLNNLRNVKYKELMSFHKKYDINGIHIFVRDKETQKPYKSFQINAYLGKENFVDPATGVSNAAQVYFDKEVDIDESVNITQYTPEKASARIFVTKLADKRVRVGGNAILINYEKLNS